MTKDNIKEKLKLKGKKQAKVMDSQLTKGVVMQTSVVDIKKPLTSHIIKQTQMKDDFYLFYQD